MSLLYAKSYKITNDITARIPTIGDILDHQEEYFRVLTAFVATPFDLMVQLDDMGLDFTTVGKYELFAMLFRGVLEDYQDGNTDGLDLILQGYDFNNLFPAIDVKAETLVFVDSQKRIIIDKRVYQQIKAVLCHLNDIEKKNKLPGNNAAKKYLLERARAKLRSASRKQNVDSELEDYIVALVNTKEFKYDFDTVRSLSLYQFHRSLKQILKRLNYDQIMSGYYAGNLDIKKVDRDSLNWLSSK